MIALSRFPIKNKYILLSMILGVILISGWLIWKEFIKNEQPVSKQGDLKIKSYFVDIQGLMSIGYSSHCTFKSTKQGQSIIGDYYIDSLAKRVRGDITFQTDQGGPESHVNNHLIADADYIYFWDDLNKGRGMVFRTRMEENERELLKEKKINYSEITAKREYKCESWTVDQNFLDLPQDIMFSRLNDIRIEK